MRIELAPRIIVDSEIRFGKPVIEGTRVPVDLVVSELANGLAMEEIADEYGITRDDILAVLAYSASVLAADEIRATA